MAKKSASKTSGNKVVKKAKAEPKAPKKAASSSEGKIESRKLVIVESPTKAKTIRKFLGRDYVVESCMGHVRDLPQSAKDIPEKFKKEKWANLGVNVDDHFDPIYCIPKNKTKIVSDLRDKISDATELILATDEDREGESISWHLVNVLKPKIPIKRMVFNEITKEAIQGALNEFRDIDMNLVRAQEARRILDRLVGYTISPFLWKKVAYGLSAGRVQSVAVRLVSEREHERLKFKKSKYWDVTAENEKEKTQFSTRLVSFDGKRVASGKDFDSDTGQLLKGKEDILALDETQADKIRKDVEKKDWIVTEVEERPVSRKPAPPFITSTLQQEANRKLGLGSRETMQVAQKLYEKGLITYMRTDSMFLSEQAIQAARKEIVKLYGKDYLPKDFRDYGKKKVKGAQEAHEAIRPAGTEFALPEDAGLVGVEAKLYDLIWKRTMACQMVNSEHKQVTARIQAGNAIFGASGMTIEFAGFLKAYVEGSDDPDLELENNEVRLPDLKKNDKIKVVSIKSNEHETKPPARFTEASLIQMLEREGVGRPSTYASIIGTIQDRGYVKKVGNALVPTFTALVVSKLLRQHLPDYVETGFTSAMEQALDDIAAGDLDQEKYLTSVYFGDKGLKKQVERREKEVKEENSRSIKLEGLKNLDFRVGRYGAYVCRPTNTKGEEVCASIPENQYPGDITEEIANKLIDQKINGADSIGKDPETGEPIYVLSGRYGPYVQLGEGDATNKEVKPKRMALPQGLEPEKVTLEQALWLLTLPRKLGMHPQLKKEIKLGLGRFGPYVVCDGDYRSIPRAENLFGVELPRALELFAQPKKGRGRSVPLKELGPHPDSKVLVQVLNGKYGPYIKCGDVNVSLPEGVKPEEVTMKLAMDLISNKAKPEKTRRRVGA